MLAVQTAKASKEISAQAKAVQISTGSAVETIKRITARMQEINQYTSAIAAAVEEQNITTSEISHNVANAARETKVVVSVFEKVANSTAKTGGSADTMLTASQAVEAAAKKLREKVEGFLHKVAV